MKNNDLISRSALIAAYDAAHKGPPGGARKLIEEAPAVDAVPVVHGRWHLGPLDEWYCESCICDLCGCEWVTTKRDMDNYCPNCGAKLDGSGEAKDGGRE